ncbi:inositol monophosphatase family protein [Paenibacillus macerans]|uniref:inositol monophosphatase family protein n=1 Tax=Paenibacillus macerans TaxID=44252 RepID=UPI00203F1741|nr:inositol monophosphatase family protein [Paenibacillus macerans]MCM3703024.1 inositol monophosphatase family protein [Paenibacillus macerans]
MNGMDVERVLGWLEEAAQMLRDSLQEEREISQKTGALDLVTDMDRRIEQFLVRNIREFYPGDRILGEEGTGDRVEDLAGRVWILDPIDGTMNFIKQKENFAVMIAVVENGVGKCGFIYDVMRSRLIWGGPEIGVYYNGHPLPPWQDQELKDSLVAINWQMFADNVSNVKALAWGSCGVRIQSCAGTEFIHLLLGKQSVYVSKLAPWDYAAGRILCETVGIRCSTIEGGSLGWLESIKGVFATPRAYESAIQILNKQ